MDAMPVTMEQVLGGWAAQLDKGARRIESALSRARLLAIGGTAVGSVSRLFLFFLNKPYTANPRVFSQTVQDSQLFSNTNAGYQCTSRVWQGGRSGAR